MAYYPSDSVKIFPTVRRNDEKDRKARLNTEENIVRISNNLSGDQSYVLDGFQISEDGLKLSSGVCIIGGYYFKIENTINLEPLARNNYLYFKIKLLQNEFKELIPYESNNLFLDYENNFIALKIEFEDTDIENVIETHAIDSQSNPVVIYKYNLLISKKIIKEDNKRVWIDNIESRIISHSQFIMDDGKIPESD